MIFSFTGIGVTILSMVDGGIFHELTTSPASLYTDQWLNRGLEKLIDSEVKVEPRCLLHAAEDRERKEGHASRYRFALKRRM